MDSHEDCRARSPYRSHSRRACCDCGTSSEAAGMQRWLTCCIAALVISLATISAASADMRIGLAAPLTGPRAWAGEETRAGAEAAVQDLNDRGGSPRRSCWSQYWSTTSATRSRRLQRRKSSWSMACRSWSVISAPVLRFQLRRYMKRRVSSLSRRRRRTLG